MAKSFLISLASICERVRSMGQERTARNPNAGSSPVTTYSGEIFGKNAATVTPNNPENLAAIWCFCSSPGYSEAVRRIDQKLNVTNATLVKKSPSTSPTGNKSPPSATPTACPSRYSDDPTQWLFHGHPQPATDPLQVAVARLVGYRWPAEQEAATAGGTAGAEKYQAKSASSAYPASASSYQNAEFCSHRHHARAAHARKSSEIGLWP